MDPAPKNHVVGKTLMQKTWKALTGMFSFCSSISVVQCPPCCDGWLCGVWSWTFVLFSDQVMLLKCRWPHQTVIAIPLPTGTWMNHQMWTQRATSYDISTAQLDTTLIGQNPPLLCMLIHREPGIGKSKAIQKATEHFVQRGQVHATKICLHRYCGISDWWEDHTQ